MSARSFSSPQGELDMHRLRRALEKVSFDQAVGGKLEESDSEMLPSSREAVSRRSLTDSSENTRTHTHLHLFSHYISEQSDDVSPYIIHKHIQDIDIGTCHRYQSQRPPYPLGPSNT